ncbi:MAG: anthranilate phosphoribosyltransferase [Candidatus Omnitrophica bacterium]|nr:anthranilate phosphoribosyltransferase [Candidatus Omnitrophota bacterium]MBU1870026.1 anthranilate phosphoribosyltransferase [Candidatus Omnitrophota bacterium]
MIEEAVPKLAAGKDLNAEEMTAVMEEILRGNANTPQIVSFLTGLSRKGETVEELTAAVKAMRCHVTKINTRHKVVLDTCGTGGDTKGTFNISTAAAFVVSGSGIAVAKHGNRSVSSACGSADLLEAAGINIDMPIEKIERCLDEIGLAFLFAQKLHPAMKYAMPARKEIGKRTMFNILGPLSNPAGATHQLVGVYDRKLTEPLARVLANLGTARALVVHSEDGLDEISIAAKTFITEEYKGEIRNYEIRPEDFGIKSASLSDLSGGSLQDNLKILMDILEGVKGPKQDVVLLNAGAAIYASEAAVTIKEGVELARRSIESGKALEKFKLLKERS